MSNQRERDALRRQEKLDRIAEQVEGGTLTIRQMTPAERKASAARPKPEKTTRKRNQR
jgi:hypothetical protein